MPAKKGGAPRKGQLAKKAQLEKLVQASKKASAQTEKAPPKEGNTSSVKDPRTPPNKNGNQASSLIETNIDQAQNIPLEVGHRTSANLARLEQLPEAAPIQPESIPQLEEVGDRTATIRLPYQPRKFFPTKKSVVYPQPAQLTVPKPTAFKNPNKVVLRLPSTQSPQATTFLSLAQELRNHIYELAMPRNKYRIQWIPREDQRPTELTYVLPLKDHKGPNLTARAGRLRRNFDLPKRAYIEKEIPRYRLSPGPTALLLVSKQVYIDTAPMFYGRNIFSFAAMKPLGKFLNNLRPETLSMIRSLELIHSTASNPQLRQNQTWKHKHDERWESLCFQIRNQCDRLQSLTLDLYVKDLPFKLGAHASWMSPLYAFMALKNLKHIDIRLHQAEADDAVLEVEAYKVRKALMSNNFYEPAHSTGNKPILEKTSPRKAHPGVNALRVTVGNRRVPATCIKPSLGPRATTFWTPPTPSQHGEEAAVTTNKNKTDKGKGKEGITTALAWTPPATLIGTALKADNKGEGKAVRRYGVLINRSLKGRGEAIQGKGEAIGTKTDAAIKGDNKGKAKTLNSADRSTKAGFKRTRKVVIW
ncbi:MAG: hypothetical protein Q9226_000651 [Calogaya cf. arnoldii]